MKSKGQATFKQAQATAQTQKQKQVQVQKQARQSKAPSTPSSAQAEQSAPTKQKAKIASRIERAKAFLIDIFLLYVPVLYVCYFVLGSKEAFLGNQVVIFACSAFFGVVQALFLSTKAQSPGLKAYDLYLIDTKKGRKLSFLRVILRYIAFLISASLLFGLLMSFLRKDGLALHDLLSQSCIVRKV